MASLLVVNTVFKLVMVTNGLRLTGRPRPFTIHANRRATSEMDGKTVDLLHLREYCKL